MEDFQIMHETLFQIQVCSKYGPDKIKELEEIVQSCSPSGTKGNWHYDSSYEPVQCAENQDRWHYIFVC